MASIPSEITDLLGKGAQLTRNDLLEIRTAIYSIEAPARFDVAADVGEAVALIVQDPEYQGDIELSDLAEPEDEPGR